MFPINDENEEFEPAYGVYALIAFTIVAYIISIFLPDDVIHNLAFVPKEIFRSKNIYSFITAIFLHKDIFHLLGNMWFLWIFGDNVEDFVGRFKFFLLYFVSGIGAYVLYFLSVSPEKSVLPLIGASGAIAGILGAYLVLFRKNELMLGYTAFFTIQTVTVPAYLYIGGWFVLQFILNYTNNSDLIAYGVHVAGFLIGAVFALLIKVLSPLEDSSPLPAKVPSSSTLPTTQTAKDNELVNENNQT